MLPSSHNLCLLLSQTCAGQKFSYPVSLKRIARFVFVSTQSVVQRLVSPVSIEYHFNVRMLTGELTGLTHMTLSAVALTCRVKDALLSGRLMVQGLKNHRQNGKKQAVWFVM